MTGREPPIAAVLDRLRDLDASLRDLNASLRSRIASARQAIDQAQAGLNDDRPDELPVCSSPKSSLRQRRGRPTH